MSDILFFMSVSAHKKRANRGAYDQPFSGVGVEFFPLGVPPDSSGVVLHESGYQASSTRWMFPNVYSPFWRLYYNYLPGHQVVFPDCNVPLSPEHLVLIPERRFFHCVGQVPVRRVWLAFSVARALSPSQSGAILLKPSPTEQSLLDSLPALFGRTPGHHRERVFHASLALLHLVLCRPELGWSERSAPPTVLHAAEQMALSLAHPLSISDSARAAGLSVRGFSAAFRRWYGMSPARHFVRLRIREACRLLAGTQETIDVIAEKTGFANRHHFSRVFQRVCGLPPAQFRRTHATADLCPECPAEKASGRLPASK